jgi:hypothetical protein
MSKIAGLKGRSPETYPDPSNGGAVSTAGEQGAGATITTTPTPLITPIEVEVAEGQKVIAIVSGTIDSPSSLTPVFATIGITMPFGTPGFVDIALENSPVLNNPIAFSTTVESLPQAENPAFTVGVTGEVSAGTASVIDVSLVVIVTSG